MSNELDDIDLRLISELGANGNIRYIDLAEKLGIALSTVSKRIQRLQSENYIKMLAMPDLVKMGYKANAIIALDVELSKIKDVCAKLVVIENIHFVGILYGRFDIIIFTHFKSSEDLSDFIQSQLSQINGVVHTECFILAEMPKRYGSPHPWG